MKKILVIDDDKNIGAILKVKLEKKGDRQVLHADNGFSGLELARRESPDLIVLDINMPGMDGGEVRAELVTTGQTRHIPVIFLTSLISEYEEKDRHGRSGGQTIISKHKDINEIVRQIEALLG